MSNENKYQMIRVRPESFEKLGCVAKKFRLSLVETVALVLDGWDRLSQTKQNKALRREHTDGLE